MSKRRFLVAQLNDAEHCWGEKKARLFRVEKWTQTYPTIRNRRTAACVKMRSDAFISVHAKSVAAWFATGPALWHVIAGRNKRD
jgi:hypothetical protein